MSIKEINDFRPYLEYLNLATSVGTSVSFVVTNLNQSTSWWYLSLPMFSFTLCIIIKFIIQPGYKEIKQLVLNAKWKDDEFDEIATIIGDKRSVTNPLSQHDGVSISLPPY